MGGCKSGVLGDTSNCTILKPRKIHIKAPNSINLRVIETGGIRKILLIVPMN